MTKQKIYILNGLLFLFLISAFTITPMIGESKVNIIEAFSKSGSMSAEILFGVRLPRIVFTFLVGGGLALVGAVYQALLRNDLATPYTLGVSSGGAFGAVLAIKSGIVFQLFGLSTITIFSILGSLLSILIIYFVARNRIGISTFTLILAGVTISMFFSAVILFIHYLADFTETYRMVRWLMGSLDVSGWNLPITLSIFLILIYFYFHINIPAFNLILAGRDVAQSKGVNVQKLQKGSFFLASILVGVIVSMAGPIGFIGLIIPHSIRLLYGAGHKKLLPFCILIGGAFLVWCDTIARTIISPAELPVGILTSMFGGPFFVYLLIRRKRN
ncbi:MAG: iron ABC transporter permease [Calditrichaceae bacterium]|nr:iron ABC transporter permease [Calditrichaceae bacterium]